MSIRSKSKLNPAVKKPSIPRSGLVDALALPLPVTPSAPLLSAASTPVVVASSVSKEIKKSQLKDRMSLAAAQPVARQDSNSVHHRSDSAPNLSSGKTDKFRTEVGMPSTRPDNGVKTLEKHRQRPDPTCSAARTEIHHITKDPNKANFRQSEIPHSTNHSRITDPNQTHNSRSDHTAEPVKPRSETIISKGNPVQVRSDLGIVKNDTPPSSRPIKVDSIKPRQDSNSSVRGSEGSNKQSRADNTAASSDSKSSSVIRGTENNKQSRWENITPSEIKNRFEHVQNTLKVESIQNKLEATLSDASSASSSKSGKNSKPTPAVGPSLANSLASFVDSGLRWTDPCQVLDLSDDQQQQQPRQMSKVVDARADSLIVKDSVPKVEDTEDQESLLQRDLAMVLEEISQITRLVESKDSQPPPMTKSSDSRTKSVIKTTGSLSTSHSPASAPSSTPNSSSRQSMTSGSALLPKLTSATRTPPPPPLTVSTPVSRISSSPTGANISVNLISPNPTHSSRTMSPVSSDHLKSGEKV